MTNPLTTLDELIWKQFEKVTVAANKRLGWDKYDLAQIADTVDGASLTGAGISYFAQGILEEEVGYVAGGILGIYVGWRCYRTSQRRNEKEYNDEINSLAQTGAARIPTMKPWRPLLLAGGGIAFGLGIGIAGFFAYYFPVLQSSLTPKTYLPMILSSITCTLLGISTLSGISANYFRSQRMTAPATKENT